MKTTCIALSIVGALLNLPARSQAQHIALSPPTSHRFSMGPLLGNLKVKDLQTSPVMYVANPKGVQLTYEHRAAGHLLQVDVQASASRFIAPALGIRQFKFTDEQITGETTRNTVLLAPSLYQGTVEVGYLRRVNTANPANKWRSYAGLGLHNWLGYADGVAMTTWAINAATLNATAAGEWQIGAAHQLTLQGAVPLVGLVSRLPYSNVLSYPERRYFDLFFSKGTHVATWNRLQRLHLQAGYRASLSRHLGLSLQYQLEWFHYSEPRSISTLAHQGALQLAYAF